jgi:hypothetical protein
LDMLNLFSSGMPTGFQTAVDSLDPKGMALVTGFIMAIMLFSVVLAIGIYIFTALAMMTTAKRIGTPDGWLAWVPVGNTVLMANMAEMHWWPILLIIPYAIFYGVYFALSKAMPLLALLFLILSYVPMLAFSVYQIVWQWKICEKRDKPGWWAVLTLLPFWACVMWGILAWSKD